MPEGPPAACSRVFLAAAVFPSWAPETIPRASKTSVTHDVRLTDAASICSMQSRRLGRTRTRCAINWQAALDKQQRRP